MSDPYTISDTIAAESKAMATVLGAVLAFPQRKDLCASWLQHIIHSPQILHAECIAPEHVSDNAAASKGELL